MARGEDCTKDKTKGARRIPTRETSDAQKTAALVSLKELEEAYEEEGAAATDDAGFVAHSTEDYDNVESADSQLSHAHVDRHGIAVPAELDYEYLITPSAVRRCAKELKDVQMIGLDIETAATQDKFGERQGTIRLIQIGVEDHPRLGTRQWVIDVRRTGLDALRPILRELGREDMTTLIHNAHFEARWFIYHCGLKLPAVVDTLVISRAIDKMFKLIDDDHKRHASHSLANVVKRLFGIQLDKTEQSSLWSRPNLRDGQLDYAALDAAVMHPVYKALMKDVETIDQELKKLQPPNSMTRSEWIASFFGSQKNRSLPEDFGFEDWDQMDTALRNEPNLLSAIIDCKNRAIAESCERSITRKRKELQDKGRFDDGWRVAAAIRRSESLEELEEAWQASSQMAVFHTDRETARIAYAQRKKQLMAAGGGAIDEDDDEAPF